MDDIGPRRGDPDIAFDIDDRVPFQLFPFREIGDAAAGPFQFAKFIDIQACAVMDSAP